ncbi:hypothetical protein TRVA0_001S03312 [Trichomonascus vanleenenianus]|uniref:uncharacterized protein n=1 Tax=Trichomonascus vanleenenianus TaxID=2268995 RepID=UPI003ECA997C
MKLSRIVGLVGLSLYASPACDGSQKLDVGDWRFSKVDNSHLSGLVSTMKKHKVSLTSVIEDGNHAMSSVSPDSFSKGEQSSHLAQALKFASSDDFDDFGTDKWVPQGISSTQDAHEKGDWNGKKAWVVSWHNKDDTSVRVTFIDQDTHKYRHVLLVYPTAKDNFNVVKLHAGGIVWYGDTLWVVDTSIGVRVFDLSNVWQVSKGDGVGKSGDKWTAANYKYVIPQKAYYKMSPSGFRFSYVSLNRGDSPDTLLFGEYQKKDKADTTRHIKASLDYNKRALKDSKPVWGYCVGTARMQGAVHAGSTVYLSQSNGEDPGKLIAWKPGSASKSIFAAMPRSPEDLSYNPAAKKLYTVTEAANHRYVLTYNL